MAIRFALIVGALLFVLGLGWYVQHRNEVHAWLRPLGGIRHAEDEFVVKQHTVTVVPGCAGEVHVRVGDIKQGRSADLEILGPASAALASTTGARVGDRIGFTHSGKQHQLEVMRYVEKIGASGRAVFRILPATDGTTDDTTSAPLDLRSKQAPAVTPAQD